MKHVVKMFRPYDLRPTIEITVFTLTSLSTIVVAVRFYCRFWIVGRLKNYDYLTILAVLCTWALCACNHYQLLFGSGAQSRVKLPPTLSPEQRKAQLDHMLVGSAASWYAYHIGYLLDLFLVKLSILLFYLSFATHRKFRILVFTTMAVVTTISLTMICILAVQCPKNPKAALSSTILKDHGRYHCFDLKVILYWQAGFNILSDVLILALPMPLLLRLRMNKAKRWSLITVFSVGLLVPIASGIRFWGLYLWARSGRSSRYYGGYIIFWSQVEINTAIICASAPSLQPLFKHIFYRLPVLQRSRGAYYYYGGRHDSVTRVPVEEIRDTRHNRVNFTDRIEPPTPSYQRPNIQFTGTQSAPGSAATNLTPEEEEIRTRVRLFSSKCSSIHSYSPSPIQPVHMLKSS